MATLHAIPLAILVTAFTASALAQGTAASAPSPAPTGPSRLNPNSPANAQTPAAPPATAQTPAAPAATSPMVTPEGPRPPTPSPGNTPGPLVMTPQEQQQYRADLAGARTGSECRAVVARQRALVAQRAKERGEAPPNNPGADPCTGR